MFPYIIKLFHYFEDKENVYLILEYAGKIKLKLKKKYYYNNYNKLNKKKLFF